MDMTNAYDTVQWPMLDIAMRMIGLPEDHIDWMRRMLGGHARAIATALGTQCAADAVELSGGVPQGCESSPGAWLLVHNLMLRYVRLRGGDGYRAPDAEGMPSVRRPLRGMAYADDTQLHDATKTGVQKSMQRAAVAIAVLGVRLNPKKTFYAWSPRTTCEDYTRVESEGGLHFHGLDSSGVWRNMRAADVPPVGDPAAPVADMAARGVTRNLGLFLSYCGVRGSPHGKWDEQVSRVQRTVAGFFAGVRRARPNFDQLKELVGGVLLQRLAHPLKHAPIPDVVIAKVRHQTAQAGREALRLPPMGADENRADEVVLAAEEAGGLGVPDLLARLTAEAASTLLWALNSPDRDVHDWTHRAIAELYVGVESGPPRAAARATWTSTARHLNLLRDVKAQLHKRGQPPPGEEHGPAPWPSGAASQGVHEPGALAKVALLHLGEVAVRALNPRDVATLARGEGLLPNKPGSTASVREVVERGSRKPISGYTHVTGQLDVALWFAESARARERRSPRRIVAIDVRKVAERLQREGAPAPINLYEEATRRAHGIPKGTPKDTADHYASWAVETLLWGAVRMDEIIAVRGALYLDTSMLMRDDRAPTKQWEKDDLYACITPEGLNVLAAFWSEAYEESTAGHARLRAVAQEGGPDRLLCAADASIQRCKRRFVVLAPEDAVPTFAEVVQGEEDAFRRQLACTAASGALTLVWVAMAAEDGMGTWVWYLFGAASEADGGVRLRRAHFGCDNPEFIKAGDPYAFSRRALHFSDFTVYGGGDATIIYPFGLEGVAWELATGDDCHFVEPPRARADPVAFAQSQLRSAARHQRRETGRRWKLAIEEVGASDYLTGRILSRVIHGQLLGDAEYTIDRIVEEAVGADGRPVFRVRWIGFDPGEDDAWVREADLPRAAVHEFRHGRESDSSSEDEGAGQANVRLATAKSLGWNRAAYLAARAYHHAVHVMQHDVLAGEAVECYPSACPCIVSISRTLHVCGAARAQPRVDQPASLAELQSQLEGCSGEGDSDSEPDDDAPATARCVCGYEAADAFARDAHVATAPGGEAHGAPPDERERAAGACVLYDERRHQIVDARAGRLVTSGDQPTTSMYAEALAMSRGYAMMMGRARGGMAFCSATSDCQSMLRAARTVRAGLGSRAAVRRTCMGPLQTMAAQERAAGLDAALLLLEPRWGGAEHNMDPRGEERLEVAARLNWVCDALAKAYAQTGYERELDYHGYWQPLSPHEAPAYYLTGHGRAWSTEPYAHAKALVGASSMRRAMLAPCVGLTQRQVVAGDVDGALTVEARRRMSTGARAAAHRAQLGQLRAPLRELVACGGGGAKGVQAIRTAMGGVDMCFGCGGEESYRHWRFSCEASRAGLANVELAQSEQLASVGLAFWWHMERRVSYTGAAVAQPALQGWPGVQVWKDGRVRLTGDGEARGAVVGGERVRVLQSLWAGPPRDARFAPAVARLLMTSVLEADDGLAVAASLPPAVLAWAKQSGGFQRAVLQAATAVAWPAGNSARLPSERPALMREGVPHGDTALWTFETDALTSEDWATTPYEHDVVAAVNEVEDGCLDAVWRKMAATAAAERRALVFVHNLQGRSQTEVQQRDYTQLVAVLPPGTLPWGSAAGWGNVERRKRRAWQPQRHTHSWHVDEEGVLHAPSSDDVEEQQRHVGLYNTADVHVLLFSKPAKQSVWASGVPAHEGIAELAYVLAGIGGVSTEGRWPVWQGEGKGDGHSRRLSLRVQHRGGGRDPARPLAHAFYQPPRLDRLERLRLESDRNCDAEALAARLDELAARAPAEAVVDGAVPVALRELVTCIGAPAAERTAAITGVAAAGCEELQWQELNRGDAARRALRELGVPLEGARGTVPRGELAPCMGCGARTSCVICVRRADGVEAQRVVDAAMRRWKKRCTTGLTASAAAHREARVQRTAEHCGALVCVGCAALPLARAAQQQRRQHAGPLAAAAHTQPLTTAAAGAALRQHLMEHGTRAVARLMPRHATVAEALHRPRVDGLTHALVGRTFQRQRADGSDFTAVVEAVAPPAAGGSATEVAYVCDALKVRPKPPQQPKLKQSTSKSSRKQPTQLLDESHLYHKYCEQVSIAAVQSVLSAEQRAKDAEAENARAAAGVGTVTVVHVDRPGGDELGKLVNIQRGTAFGNPFPLKGADDRAKVCTAFERYAVRGQSLETVKKDLDLRNVPVAQRGLDALREGVTALATDVAKEANLRLGCTCKQEHQFVRCHGDTLKLLIEREARQMVVARRAAAAAEAAAAAAAAAASAAAAADGDEDNEDEEERAGDGGDSLQGMECEAVPVQQDDQAGAAAGSSSDGWLAPMDVEVDGAECEGVNHAGGIHEGTANARLARNKASKTAKARAKRKRKHQGAAYDAHLLGA